VFVVVVVVTRLLTPVRGSLSLVCEDQQEEQIFPSSPIVIITKEPP
jgi:hypothetical protein